MNKTAAQKLANDYYHAGIMLAMQEAGLVKESAPRRSIPGYDEAKVELQRENKATTPEAINKQRVRNNMSSAARKELSSSMNPTFSRLGNMNKAIFRDAGFKEKKPSDLQVSDLVAKKTKGLKY